MSILLQNAMTWKKGMKKTGGRKKGAVNMSTMTKRVFLDYIATEGSGRFLKELEALKGEDYVKYFIHLLEFNYPKLSRTEVEASGSINLFTPEQAEKILNEHKSKGSSSSNPSK